MMRSPLNEGKMIFLVDEKAHKNVSMYGSHSGIYESFKKNKLLLIADE